MVLILLVFLGGVLTILSPCVLPVLPFIFARAEQPFFKSGLPMLVGMAITFAGIATLASVGGSWALHINQYGRIFALILLSAFAITLLSRHLADLLARPFVALGNRLLQSSETPATNISLIQSLLLGVATGLLWAPCAGPILGLVLTGAAISGPNTKTTLLLFTYAAGATTSLAIALLAGSRVFAALKKSLGAGEWVRRSLGLTVLLAVIVIALGWDTNILTRLSLNSTNHLEQSLINTISPSTLSDKSSAEGTLPSFTGASPWLNSPELTPESLHGKVVLIDFWTYSCINCLRALPHVEAWYEKYKDHGLVVIGVHTPEFAFEKDEANVHRTVSDLGITYPVVLDNNYSIWQGFNNHFWPAHYFIDAAGNIRGHHFGEGNYIESEKTIRNLLTEAGYKDLPSDVTGSVNATGIQADADVAHINSPETYIGYARAKNFSSSGGFIQDKANTYTIPSDLTLNQWGLAGNWQVDKEKAVLNEISGKIQFRFYARDLHLVLGPSKNGKPIRFRVQLDGATPDMNHGVDIDKDGNGIVKEQRLYQLIRQSGEIKEHTFSIEFLDSGVQAFAFTFG